MLIRVPLTNCRIVFFFQAEDGIRDLTVTGVQTCALPIANTLSGAGQLRIGRGRVVGRQALALIGGVVRVGGAVSSMLSADVPASLFTSPVEFDSITGTYQIANGVVKTRDLLYASRVMRV